MGHVSVGHADVDRSEASRRRWTDLLFDEWGYGRGLFQIHTIDQPSLHVRRARPRSVLRPRLTRSDHLGSQRPHRQTLKRETRDGGSILIRLKMLG